LGSGLFLSVCLIAAFLSHGSPRTRLGANETRETAHARQRQRVSQSSRTSPVHRSL